MAVFAKQPLLYEMRPSSTKLQLINVLFHCSHSMFQHACVYVSACAYVPAGITAFNILYVGIQEKEGFNLQESSKPSQSAVELYLRNLEIFH